VVQRTLGKIEPEELVHLRALVTDHTRVVTRRHLDGILLSASSLRREDGITIESDLLSASEGSTQGKTLSVSLFIPRAGTGRAPRNNR